MSNSDGGAETAVLRYIEGFFSILGEQPTLKIEYQTQDEIYLYLQGQSSFLSEDKETLAKELGTLAEVFIHRRFHTEKEVQIDINGVKLSKRKKLEKFALDAAEKAKESKRKIRLNPMTPEERKWIHISLATVEGVETYSVNEGAERRVIIKPTN